MLFNLFVFTASLLCDQREMVPVSALGRSRFADQVKVNITTFKDKDCVQSIFRIEYLLPHSKHHTC